MGVKIKERADDPGAWWLYIDHQGKRKAKRIGVGSKAKKAAELAALKIQARLALGDTSDLAESKAQPLLSELPRLRDALPEWIGRQERANEIRRSTAKAYRSRLATWAYPHVLSDGRLLGDLPVNTVTREMIGAVIWRVREAGRSLAIIEAIRNPIRCYYASLIETKVLPGPNPAGDFRYFIGKGAHRKARRNVTAFFAQEEGPQLVATATALWPRWAPFILTGLLGGLRWGESAALLKTDVDWIRSRIHVQRTYSEKGGRIEPCKDGEDRWVKTSPSLLAALRDQLAAMELEGQVKDWTTEQRTLMFPTTAGRIVRYSHFLEGVWQPLLSKAGLPYRQIPFNPSHLRYVATERRGRPPVGPAADGACNYRPDGGHVRSRPAGAPRDRCSGPRSLSDDVGMRNQTQHRRGSVR
jgi:integrase